MRRDVGQSKCRVKVCGLPQRAQIGPLVGGHRWHGHELREAAPGVQVLETLVNLDTPALAHEATLDLMARRRLAGIYCAGGGMEGTIQAIRDEGMGRGITLVVNELTEASRLALADGIAARVIATPIRRLAAELMAQMVAAGRNGRPGSPGQILLPVDLHLPESL